MTLPFWKTTDSEFRTRFDALKRKLSLDEGLRAAGADQAESARQSVRRILDDVRARGDVALLEHTERLDGCKLGPGQLQVSPQEIEQAVARCPGEFLDALRRAAERIRTFQEAVLVCDPEPLVCDGRTLALRYLPVDSAAIYVPGAAASLASSVLMSAVPAKVAGVQRLVMATPPLPDGRIPDDRLAAAAVAGVDEVYRLGGAVAVAALAYGTASVPRVDFIAGPGNIYTTLAKREVFGQVGIDMFPGPSEVVIIADSSAEAEHVAADLLSQSEHNPGSSILMTDDEELAQGVQRAIDEQLQSLPRAETTRSCLQEYGAIILAGTLDECISLANELAPEHLEIITVKAEEVVGQIRHAGAIFLGPWTPVAVGDYIAGPSHVLPTSGTARFSSGLTANDFLKRSSIIRYDRAALAEDAGDIGRLAHAEGLAGHARSVTRRVGGHAEP